MNLPNEKPQSRYSTFGTGDFYLSTAPAFKLSSMDMSLTACFFILKCSYFLKWRRSDDSGILCYLKTRNILFPVLSQYWLAWYTTELPDDWWETAHWNAFFVLSHYNELILRKSNVIEILLRKLTSKNNFSLNIRVIFTIIYYISTKTQRWPWMHQ